jgi:hypothetical protein
MMISKNKFRAPVLAYLMIGEAFNIRSDSSDEDAYDRLSGALDHVWENQLSEYERLVLNYETRIATAEALGEPTC